MFTIKAMLDEEGGLDAIDVLGDLVISDGHSTLTARTTFLDTWLEALIDARNQLRLLGNAVVDVEEPSPVRIQMNPEGSFTISYEDQTVVADSLNALENALRIAGRSLLDRVGNLPQSPMNTALKVIREFSEEQEGERG